MRKTWYTITSEPAGFTGLPFVAVTSSLRTPAPWHLGLSVQAPNIQARSVMYGALPKGSEVLFWGILPQFIVVFPYIETLHSTIYVLWTLKGL